ncbi:MAG: CPBP family intramembrane metalloprotease [Clostridia bacterium]|nr:CPBP family intramembrane metalloprotease [Clostridia bacterium]
MADINGKTRKALLVTLGVMLLRLPVGWGIQLLLPNPEGDPAIFYAALILQETLLWGLPALLLLPWRSRRLAVRSKCGNLCVAAVFMGLAAQWALMALTPRWVAFTGASQAAIMLPQNEIQWALAVLALVVIPAVTEEAFFRGGLLTGLCDTTSALNATLLTTVIFALMHGSLAGFPAHMAVSLLCTLAMMTKGRLRAPIILHMCYNGAALLLRDVSPALTPVLPLALMLAALVLWMLSRILWRGRYRRVSWQEGVMLGVIILGAAAMYLPEIL